jgi:hypothetical protein
MKFVVKFVDLRFCLVQGLLANERDLVDPSLTSSYILEDRLQQAAALQAIALTLLGLSLLLTFPPVGDFF